MIWGYPHFGKPPYIYIYVYIYICVCITFIVCMYDICICIICISIVGGTKIIETWIAMYNMGLAMGRNSGGDDSGSYLNNPFVTIHL